MNLIAYNPWKLFDDLHSGMERRFGRELRRDEVQESDVTAAQWKPTVDIQEQSDRFVLYVDVPGVDPKDIDVTMDKDVLTIRGERNEEQKQEHDRFSRRERVHGLFYRRFALPASADADEVAAHGKHGVLQIVIPKREQDQPRRVPIAA